MIEQLGGVLEDDEIAWGLSLSPALEDDMPSIFAAALDQTAEEFSIECGFMWTNEEYDETNCTSCCLSDPEAAPTITPASTLETYECGLVGKSPSGLPMKSCTLIWDFLDESLLVYKWSFWSTDTINEVQVNGAWTFNSIKHISISQTGQQPVCVTNTVTVTSSQGSFSGNPQMGEMQLFYTTNYDVSKLCCPLCTAVSNNLQSHLLFPPQ